jgi:polysaccharide export outer membrane protein
MRSHRQLQLFVSLILGLGAATGRCQNVAAAGAGPAAPVGIDTGAISNPTSPSPSSQFVLGVADVIHVNVWKNPDLSQTVTVGPDGFVSLPLLGEINVSNMTASQLGQSLTSRLSTYILNPQVTVSVVDIRSRQVYVLGQVAKPGGYPLIAPITVLQLIAQAGGLNPYANRKNIVVLRTANQVSHKLTFNYNNAVRGDERQTISLQPGDTVIVP